MITAAELAKELGLDPSFFRQAIRRKALQGTKVGRDWLFTPDQEQIARDYVGTHKSGRPKKRNDKMPYGEIVARSQWIYDEVNSRETGTEPDKITTGASLAVEMLLLQGYALEEIKEMSKLFGAKDSDQPAEE